MIRSRQWGLTLFYAIPFIWGSVFVIVPFLLVMKLSFSSMALSAPPYEPIFYWSDSWSSWWSKLAIFNADNFERIAEDYIYFYGFLGSLKLVSVTVAFTGVVGYAMAYAIFRSKESIRMYLLVLVMIPLWSSFLMRIYAWLGLLKQDGFINYALLSLGIIQEPLTIINTPFAVYLGMIYIYLPLMILPIFNNLLKIEKDYILAGQDLGCSPLQTFWLIILPMSKKGIVSGCLLVAMASLGDFIVPDILGNSDTVLLSKLIWLEFAENRDWPTAAAITFILTLILVIPLRYFMRSNDDKQ